MFSAHFNINSGLKELSVQPQALLDWLGLLLDFMKDLLGRPV